jgi:hypothetical protein
VIPSGTVGVKSERGKLIYKRQMAAKSDKFLTADATNCDKSVAAFCRFLPLQFCPGFSASQSLGDGVYVRPDTARMMVRYVR